MRLVIFILLCVMQCLLTFNFRRSIARNKTFRKRLYNVLTILPCLYYIYYGIYVYSGKIGIIGETSLAFIYIIIPFMVILSVTAVIFKSDYGIINIMRIFCIVILLLFSILDYGYIGKENEVKFQVIKIEALNNELSTYVSGSKYNINSESVVDYIYKVKNSNGSISSHVVSGAGNIIQVFESETEKNPRIEEYDVIKIVRNGFECEFEEPTGPSYKKYEIYVPTGTVDYSFKIK